MAGTLFGLGLSQQHDIDGVPMSGCLLYVYQANTSTPVIAYSSPALTAGLELPWPLEADSAGRIPAFWLDDGAYRARLTDADGVLQFDEGNILAVGAGAGDVTVPSTPDAAIFTTGDVSWRPVNTTKAGWVRLNGRTVGSGTSGASERANADCQSLFEYLWGTFTDAICPVVSGRGPSASADWLASKQITLFDMRNKAPFGLDTMGNVAAGGFSGVTFAVGDAVTGGSKGGAAMHTLTLAQTPAHDHTFTDSTVNTTDGPAVSPNTNTSGTTAVTLGAGVSVYAASVFQSFLAIFGTTSSQGGGAAHPNMPPFMLGTWYMRL